MQQCLIDEILFSLMYCPFFDGRSDRKIREKF